MKKDYEQIELRSEKVRNIIRAVFPLSSTQIRVVYQIRNSCKYVVYKVEVNTQRNTAKTVHRTDIVEWQGSTKTEFTSSVDAGLVEGYNLYYSELDSALDAVNDAITRYENEKYEQNGIIGQIQIVINNLENWLDTLGY